MKILICYEATTKQGQMLSGHGFYKIGYLTENELVTIAYEIKKSIEHDLSISINEVILRSVTSLQG